MRISRSRPPSRRRGRGWRRKHKRRKRSRSRRPCSLVTSDRKTVSNDVYAKDEISLVGYGGARYARVITE